MGLRPIRACLAGFLLLLPHPQAWAWGSEGHRIIADIAWDHLDNTALQKLRQYLGDNDLASISTWADDIRSGHPQTGSWHYVDISWAIHRSPSRPGVKRSNTWFIL
jgi:hypothetical protein